MESSTATCSAETLCGSAETLRQNFSSSNGLSDSSSDSESESELPSDTTATTNSKRFSAKQRAVLCAYYKTGMKGVGELHSSRIAIAAREAGLKTDQVKVYTICSKLSKVVCNTIWLCRDG